MRSRRSIISRRSRRSIMARRWTNDSFLYHNLDVILQITQEAYLPRYCTARLTFLLVTFLLKLPRHWPSLSCLTLIAVAYFVKPHPFAGFSSLAGFISGKYSGVRLLQQHTITLIRQLIIKYDFVHLGKYQKLLYSFEESP